MEPETSRSPRRQSHRVFDVAVRERNLAEAIRLAWRDLESANFCSAQVRFLAALLALYGDTQGLEMLGSRIRERIRRDKHYQPPFNDYRDDLLGMADVGSTEGVAELVKIVNVVRESPGITRSQLYRRFNVFAFKYQKLKAEKSKPPQERSPDWIQQRDFDRILGNPLFLCDGHGPEATFHVRDDVPNLRPSPTPESQSRPRTASALTAETSTAATRAATRAKGCGLAAIICVAIAFAVIWLTVARV